MRLGVDLSILNQKGTPAFYSDIFANRPAFGYAGRVFISTDTGAIYEDTGTAWVLIADAGAGTTGTLQQVTTNGNTTTQGLVVTSGNVAIGTATAGAPLDIHSTGTNAQFNGTGTNNAYVFFQNAGTSKWRLGNFYNAGANSFDIHDTTNATTRISVRNTGEVLITGYNTISNTPTFSSSGNYASNPSLNLTVPASSTFNSGASYSGMAASLLNSFDGSSTIGSGAVMAGFVGVNRQSFNAAGYTITLTQGASGIRAVCGMQVLQQTGGSFTGTITHGASLLVQGVYPTNATNITYTNYYGLLINQLDEYGGVTFTNRWGIYQGGASDKNYFAGSVGISTSTPSAKLEVSGSTTASGAVARGAVFSPTLVAAANGDTLSGVYITPTFTNGAFTGVTNWALNVVGNTTIGSTGNPTLTIRGTDTNYTGVLNLYGGGSGGQLINATGASTNNLALQINSSTVATLFSTGLGIGTVNIGSKLQVNGNAAIGYSASTAAPTNGLVVSGITLIGTTTSGGAKMEISSNGNDGLKISQPVTGGFNLVCNAFNNGGTYYLALFQAGGTTTGSITSNGTVTVYGTTSDYRLKQDFKDYDGLSLVNKIKTYDYEWKKNKSRSYGVIAHELKDILPDAVSGEKDGNLMQSVDYSKIVPLLVKSIQELNDKLVRNNIN
jgi:Chaperone of endosialidase